MSPSYDTFSIPEVSRIKHSMRYPNQSSVCRTHIPRIFGLSETQEMMNRRWTGNRNQLMEHKKRKDSHNVRGYYEKVGRQHGKALGERQNQKDIFKGKFDAYNITPDVSDTSSIGESIYKL